MEIPYFCNKFNITELMENQYELRAKDKRGNESRYEKWR